MVHSSRQAPIPLATPYRSPNPNSATNMRCTIFLATFAVLLQTVLAVPTAPMLTPRDDLQHADAKGHSKEEFWGYPYGLLGGGFGYGLGSYYGWGFPLYGYAGLGLYGGLGGFGLWKKDASNQNTIDDQSS